MSVKAYYERYWERERPSFAVDPLAHRRLELLQGTVGDAVVRAIDAGCGHGDFVAALAADGHDVLGLELSETAIDLARTAHPDCPFVPHSVEDLPWPVEANSFDVVWSFEVIEHLLEPRRLFEGAYQALRRGGIFAMTTPYHGHAKNLVLAVRGFDRHFAVEGDHIRFFSDRALVSLAESTGFRVHGLRHFGRFPPLWAGAYMWAVKG